ncbi:hypothetical protein [Variovorax paradoxus]|uniref:hypothetical protein n=1 Tax=Variovorax paradoxus TaxID=34073 RepID=UPI001932F5F4|nr:hypothetical protein INQ48_20625 [Variovorax paradoxus]
MSAAHTPGLEPEDALVIAWADFWRARHSLERDDAVRRINAARAAIAKATGSAA